MSGPCAAPVMPEWLGGSVVVALMAWGVVWFVILLRRGGER